MIQEQQSKPEVKKNFFYFIYADKFTICDLEYCSKSENTIDVKLFEIANNKKLLEIFHLPYIGDYRTHTYISRAEWFCNYLSAFKSGEISDLQYEKSLTNPTVRILIEDTTIMNAVLNCL